MIVLAKILVTAGLGILDSFVLVAGTMTTWAFVHRWVLMAVGIASGILWTLAVRRKASPAATA